MAKTKTVKKEVKKTTKKATTKKTTKKVTKEPKKVTKKVVEEVKVEEPKKVEELKEKKDKKVLLAGLLYLLCSLVWIVGGTSKIIVKESGVLDICVGVFLLCITIVYFIRYKRS